MTWSLVVFWYSIVDALQPSAIEQANTPMPGNLVTLFGLSDNILQLSKILRQPSQPTNFFAVGSLGALMVRPIVSSRISAIVLFGTPGLITM